MIYATVGTMYLDFKRLIQKMDEIASDTGERVIVQTGMSEIIPKCCEYFAFKPREDVLALQREARMVVSHAGIGSVIDVLHVQKPTVFVPRLARFGEHNNDHQIEIARAMEQRNWGRMILDIEELPEACVNPPAACGEYRPDRDRLIRSVREAIESGVRGKKSRKRGVIRI